MPEVRVGLLGLGQVGQAVVRAARRAAPVLSTKGLRVIVEAALVRDRGRPRGERVPFLTDSPAAFFTQPHDVVIEVLGGVQPAADLVTRALRAGIPVVSANKSMLASHGRQLEALALASRTSLLFEASVVAGVPFLETLGRRPLAGCVDRVEGILNGTSNYILTRMAEERLSVSDALAEAQALGYAEPVPDHDISGRDAAEKLVVLLRHLGLCDLNPEAVRRVPLTAIEPADIAIARSRGGAIKPIARASRREHGVELFVGPQFVPDRHPLAGVSGAMNGILIDGPFAGPLFYSGPGAGPDVTAATILDDVATLACVAAPEGASIRAASAQE